jgi:transcription elongation factor Elf1
MSMMDNAINSIELGVEDFKNADTRRLTSAMRNLTAGILLLFKCYLVEKSPPGSDGVLIYQNLLATVNPDGSISNRKQGNKTVDVHTMKQRIDALGVAVDCSALDTIIDIRNEIEHFHTEKPDTLVREALSEGLPLIQFVLGDLLGERPTDVFSAEAWAALREIKDIFDRELAACRATFDAVAWDSDILSEAVEKFRCPNCSSPLVRQYDPENDEVEAVHLQCVDCKNEFPLEEILEEAIVDAMAYDNFMSVKDGGEPRTYNCHECGRPTYSMEDGRCLLNCGAESSDLVCSVCEQSCTPDDFDPDTGMCSSHAWSYNKMMEED